MCIRYLSINNGKLIQRRLTLFDYLFAICAITCTSYILLEYHNYIEFYEQILLFIITLILISISWYWKPLRLMSFSIFISVLTSICMYQHNLLNAKDKFLLSYFLSSQSAILWMSILFIIATIFYWLGFVIYSKKIYQLGMYICWSAIFFGFTGIIVRWYESYLIGNGDIGHIPISNLYEVLILFCIIISLFYLYYESRYITYVFGPFTLFVVSTIVIFTLWYSLVIVGAQQIQPLVPALQSWWIKIHVPTNFIAYACFTLAAIVAFTYILKSKGYFLERLPPLEILDEIIYNLIIVGFTFFTIATILGALWANQAWGRYWSWDPKETWALIVWLSYAALLHTRLLYELKGIFIAWWAFINLLLTLFAFLGVNFLLSGLHSYGQL